MVVIHHFKLHGKIKDYDVIKLIANNWKEWISGDR